MSPRVESVQFALCFPMCMYAQASQMGYLCTMLIKPSHILIYLHTLRLVPREKVHTEIQNDIWLHRIKKRCLLNGLGIIVEVTFYNIVFQGNIMLKIDWKDSQDSVGLHIRTHNRTRVNLEVERSQQKKKGGGDGVALVWGSGEKKIQENFLKAFLWERQSFRMLPTSPPNYKTQQRVSTAHSIFPLKICSQAQCRGKA